ncbi:hypothetical protein ASPZODRAFT_329044 [Penicilliopsis zonata CBS 506.65]|uniref:Uncharacterized protein n=1 Tax=Penicilliopsis zonata CBS 506.65 TaxID=1073090 RepID=A0A1L9SVK2_9EURO|nr:hypothetical protein ASPZODRAFT_329044 [Penicilliopsis zonata CBS 506.65]OJJ51164.1 hypothetical protein ASPZODRAFT_329044 [Penicilliopsis zonata CBS 506.65]
MVRTSRASSRRQVLPGLPSRLCHGLYRVVVFFFPSSPGIPNRGETPIITQRTCSMVLRSSTVWGIFESGVHFLIWVGWTLCFQGSRKAETIYVCIDIGLGRFVCFIIIFFYLLSCCSILLFWVVIYCLRLRSALRLIFFTHLISYSFHVHLVGEVMLPCQAGLVDWL